MEMKHWKKSEFDNMELSAGSDVQHAFPDHFHYEYSIVLAGAGLQQFRLQERVFTITPGTLVLLAPHQLHAHAPHDVYGWSYKNILLSPAAVQYLQQQYPVQHTSGFFDVPFIQDATLTKQYEQLHTPGSRMNKDLLGTFLQQLYGALQAQHTAAPAVMPGTIAEIKHYVASHYPEKLQLDQLAAHFHLDKFQLIRLFKKHTGTTPNQYLTMVRIEQARTLLRQGAPLVEAALDTGFYDQAHFHRYFLHYTGLTPRQFSQRNILQDPA